MREMKICSVAFNLADPDQKKMLDHANMRSSFSGYIKRLIQRDMEGAVASQHIPDEVPIQDEISSFY